MPKWWKYAVFDEDSGMLAGVREDAPKWAKEAFIADTVERQAGITDEEITLN